MQIGQYLVTTDQETFRIFPKGRDGKSVPVLRVNRFLYLTHAASGVTVIFKNYLHQKKWCWRDSRDQKPTDLPTVRKELARLLFKGNEKLAEVLARGIGDTTTVRSLSTQVAV